MTKGTIVRDNEGDRREGTDQAGGGGGEGPEGPLPPQPPRPPSARKPPLLSSRPNMQDIQNERILKAKE